MTYANLNGQHVTITTTTGLTVAGILSTVEGARYVLVTVPAATGGTFSGPVQVAEIASIEATA